MKNQQGFIGIAILGVLFFLAVFFTMTYFHYANQAAAIENLLITKRDNNKNVLAGFSSKVKEVAKVAKMSTEAQATLIEKANQARYGKEGSKAVVQFITEQNPNADLTLLKNLSQLIESERTKYTNEQKEMLDVKNAYRTMLTQPYSKFFISLAGFPTIDLKDYDVIINQYTEDAYKTGKSEAIDF